MKATVYIISMIVVIIGGLIIATIGAFKHNDYPQKPNCNYILAIEVTYTIDVIKDTIFVNETDSLFTLIKAHAKLERD